MGHTFTWFSVSLLMHTRKKQSFGALTGSFSDADAFSLLYRPLKGKMAQMKEQNKLKHVSWFTCSTI